MKPDFNPSRIRTGSLTVEVALCLPILFTILFASFELARANMILHATESAAYEGARVGIVPGASTETIEASASSILNSVGIRNFTVNVNPAVIDETTRNIDVTILVPFGENTSIPSLFMKDPTFRGNCQLSREVPQ